MDIPPEDITTVNRVTLHTSTEVNQQITEQTERNIAYYVGRPHEIEERLNELDREWDIDRMLETQAAGLTVASVVLGIFVSRKWLLMPAVVGGFLLYHAVRGWCPPVPVFRRLGVRTQNEIDQERYALKALRGDFIGINAETSQGQSPARVSRRVLELVKST